VKTRVAFALVAAGACVVTVAPTVLGGA